MKIPTQKGVLIEFVFGDAPFRDGYDQIGSFKNDTPDWPHIYITGPIKWVDAKHSDPEWVKDFLQKMSIGFGDAFNKGKIDTSQDRSRYYLLNEDEDTVITLGYFSEEEQGPTFNASDPLFPEEFLAFLDARDKISKFYKDVLWFNPILNNYDSFVKTVQEVQENFLKSQNPDYAGVENININSSFNNYVTSITSYLNHLENRLKKRNSELYWEKFHKHTSEQYDQNVSYRFLYGLRNYIQHQSPPIHVIYEAHLENEQPITQVIIYCSKEELLKDTKWKKVKPDILKMDDKINILPHVNSMMESLNQILLKHLQDEFLYLSESAIYIHKLLQKIPYGQDRGIYETHFLKKKIVRITPHLMYTNIVEAIVEKDINKILKIN